MKPKLYLDPKNTYDDIDVGPLFYLFFFLGGGFGEA